MIAGLKAPCSDSPSPRALSVAYMTCEQEVAGSIPGRPIKVVIW